MNCRSDRCEPPDGSSKPEISSSVIEMPRKSGGSKEQVEIGLQMQPIWSILDQSVTVVIPSSLNPAMMAPQRRT
jgi:hypothetical protein